MGMTPEQWSISRLALELDLDRRTVGKRLEGVPPVASSGRGDLYRMADAARACFEPRVIRDDDDAPQDLDVERARLARVQADIKERELALLNRRLITIEEASDLVTGMIRAAKERLLGMGAEIAAELCGLAEGDDNLAPVVAERITLAVTGALSEIRDDVLRG